MYTKCMFGPYIIDFVHWFNVSAFWISVNRYFLKIRGHILSESALFAKISYLLYQYFSHSRSGFPLFFYPCEIILSQIPVLVHEKDKRHAGHTSICDVISMLKSRNHVASQGIQDFWKSFLCFSNIK